MYVHIHAAHLQFSCVGRAYHACTARAAYVTGEMGHHEVLAANAAGVTVILTEHSNSERGALVGLAAALRARLPADDYLVSISELDADPLVVM